MRWIFKKKKISHYEHLATKWLEKQKKAQEQLWFHHGGVLHEYLNGPKQFAVGTLAGLMLLVSPGSPAQATAPATIQDKPLELDKTTSLLLDLSTIVPQTVRPLTPDEEQKVAALLSSYVGSTISAQLNGIRLNTTYGYIGQEQHLYRYPGDTLYDQLPNPDEFNQFASYGIAPGLGAYGYFTYSQNTLTQEESDREKWYIAVQTFLAPGYDENVRVYNDFFKFRKMLVVNPQNGKAVIADIGDAGPAPWTGKQLGGSPEVMHYLDRVDGAARGPVLYFFIDDPENKIPLGPIAL